MSSKNISGISSKTPERLLLNAGAFFKGYVPGIDTPASAADKCLGMTQGGGTFAAVPTVRNIEGDGVRGHVKELEVIDDWEVTLTANVKELTAENLRLALGAATVAVDNTAAGYTKITPRSDFDASDYTDSLAWVGTLKGSDLPVVIIIKNALSLGGLTIAPADKAEATASIVFTAHYPLSDMETPPFEIYWPTEDAGE